MLRGDLDRHVPWLRCSAALVGILVLTSLVGARIQDTDCRITSVEMTLPENSLVAALDARYKASDPSGSGAPTSDVAGTNYWTGFSSSGTFFQGAIRTYLSMRTGL